MAQELITPQIPQAFKGLLSKSKIVQNSILERSEKKVSLLEGRDSVTLYSSDRTPASLNNELDLSSPNFIALNESYFILKFLYTVKDGRNNGAQDYPHWVCTTSPAISWFRNARVEVNGIEITQSSKVADMQWVQHILGILESNVAKLQYTDSDLHGVQKLHHQRSLKGIPLNRYTFGVKRKRAFAFADDAAGGDDFDDTNGDHKVKRLPTVEISTSEGFSETVQENCVRASSGSFEYKMRLAAPFFNDGDAWLPPGTAVKIRFDLPQAHLSRYIMVSDLGGGGNSPDTVGDVRIELKQLDFCYPTYRMDSEYVDQVRLPRELYFWTYAPRHVQKSITDDAGTIELLHNSEIPRNMVLFFSDVKMSEEPVLRSGAASNPSNRLAMIHSNLSQLRVTVNDDMLFDSPLKFQWQCSQNSDGTYFYNHNKSSYLRAYNLVQHFFGRNYGTEIPITSGDFCNHYFCIPISLNLDREVDNQRTRGNLSIDYQFSAVANSPVQVPSHADTSIKVNLLCLDQYMYTMDKEKGMKWEIV